MRTFSYDRAAPSAPVVYFLCAKQMTPIIWWPAFGARSFADSDCAFCAGCQLRLRMLRSGMMHRGCGRRVRTLRTFCDDRAAPIAPALHFLCAKQMTPVIWWPAFGAPFLLIRLALSALDASCDCAWLRSGMMHQGCGRPVRTSRTFCDDRAAPIGPVVYFLCAKEMTPIIW